MRDSILNAITKILETQFDSKKLDILLTDAVMDVLSVENKVAVMYHGKREDYSDGLYGTGSWAKKQVKLIDAGVASKMLLHVDVYNKAQVRQGKQIGKVDTGGFFVWMGEPADKSKVDVVEVSDHDKEMEDNDPILEEGRANVLAMRTKKDVVDFVATNFQGHEINLPKAAKVGDYRNEAIRLIDQFHLPK